MDTEFWHVIADSETFTSRQERKATWCTHRLHFAFSLRHNLNIYSFGNSSHCVWLGKPWLLLPELDGCGQKRLKRYRWPTERLIAPFNNGGGKWNVLVVLLCYIHNPPPETAFSCSFSTFSMLHLPPFVLAAHLHQQKWLLQSRIYLHSTSHWIAVGIGRLLA